MPTYEYACGACGQQFERRQAMTDPPLSECPSCGGPVRRLVSGGAGFLLKGAAPRDKGACSLERFGRTCCGREERCGKDPCEGEA